MDFWSVYKADLGAPNNSSVGARVPKVKHSLNQFERIYFGWKILSAGDPIKKGKGNFKTSTERVDLVTFGKVSCRQGFDKKWYCLEISIKGDTESARHHTFITCNVGWIWIHWVETHEFVQDFWLMSSVWLNFSQMSVNRA